MSDSSYPTVKYDFIEQVLKEYHIKQDMKILKDLILQILEKGYYPLIEVEREQQTLEQKENYVELTDVYGHPKLTLYTSEELIEKGHDPLYISANIHKNLSQFYDSSPTTVSEATSE